MKYKNTHNIVTRRCALLLRLFRRINEPLVAVAAFDPTGFGVYRQPHAGVPQRALAPVTSDPVAVNRFGFRWLKSRVGFLCFGGHRLDHSMGLLLQEF